MKWLTIGGSLIGIIFVGNWMKRKLIPWLRNKVNEYLR